jgi:hypothetical protein
LLFHSAASLNVLLLRFSPSISTRDHKVYRASP